MGPTGRSIPGCMSTTYFGVGYCIENISPRIDHPNYWTMPENPSGLPMLKYVGNNDDITMGSLKMCEADCDRDADCAGDLVCYYPRERGQIDVPGCWGAVSDQKFDHCVDREALKEAENNVQGRVPTGPMAYEGHPDLEVFQLQFYWEPGYFWKMTFFPIAWCFNCVEDKCVVGGMVQIYKCEASATRWRFLKQHPDDDKVQLQVDGTNICLQTRNGINTTLASCDASVDRQKYSAGNGDFKSDRFELLTYDRRCLTMHHHPKEYELIQARNCSRTRRFDTSYLIKA